MILDKTRTVGTTGIAWQIRDTAVSIEIRHQVCSIPKKLPLQGLKPLGLAKW